MKGNRFPLMVAALGFALAVLVAPLHVSPNESAPMPAEKTKGWGNPSMRPGSDDPAVRAGAAAYEAKDYRKAHDIWRPLAEAGNAEASYRIGILYDFGFGKPKDILSAIDWYRRAAIARHTGAMFNLGVIYTHGSGVEKNHKKAFKYYKEAANLCDVKAQINLGVLYAWTETIPRHERDYAEAHKWLMVASKLGSRYAAETNEDLRRYTTSKEQDEGERRMQAWFENHTCLNRATF